MICKIDTRQDVSWEKNGEDEARCLVVAGVVVVGGGVWPWLVGIPQEGHVLCALIMTSASSPYLCSGYPPIPCHCLRLRPQVFIYTSSLSIHTLFQHTSSSSNISANSSTFLHIIPWSESKGSTSSNRLYMYIYCPLNWEFHSKQLTYGLLYLMGILLITVTLPIGNVISIMDHYP